MNWFEKFFSLDEMRVSALVICLIAVVTACLVSVFLLGNINDNLLALAEACVFTVGGVTAVNGVKSMIGNKSNTDDDIPVTSSDGMDETPPKI